MARPPHRGLAARLAAAANVTLAGLFAFYCYGFSSWLPPAPAAPRVGPPAPDFTLVDHRGETARRESAPIPLLALELASLPLLAYLLWRPSFLRHLTRFFLVALGLLVVYPLLQWLPLPAIIWQSLPGQDAYVNALAGLGITPSLRPISVVPIATESAWLAILPPLAVLLVTVGLKEEALKRVVYVFLAMAAFQALLALIQFGDGSGTAFRLSPTDIGKAVGT